MYRLDLSESLIKREKLIFLFLLIGMSIFTVLIYLPEHKLYAGDDAYFHYNRIQVLMDVLKDGSFPVYIDSEAASGYGYGTRLFYSDFLLIPIALLGLVTGLIVAYKIFIVSALFLCGYFSYVASSKITGSRYVGYIVSFLVSFAYFRLVGLFLRSAFGETLSYIFIPIIAWGVYEIIQNNYKRWYLFSIGYSLLIMSHLITSLLTSFFVVLILLLNIRVFVREKKRFWALIIAGSVTIFLSAYGILPLFEQLTSVELFQQYHKELVRPGVNKVGYFELLRGLVAGFKILDTNHIYTTLWDQGAGFILSVLVILRVFIRRGNRLIKIADYSLILGGFSFIATSMIFPWGRYPFTLLNSIQFPWRFFEYVTFFLAFSGSVYLVYLVKNKLQYRIAFSFILIATVSVLCINSYNFRRSEYLKSASPVPSVANLYNLGGLEYTPARYARYTHSFWDRIGQRKEEVMRQHDSTFISNYLHRKSKISFDIDTKSVQDSIIIPLFYYKGYRATFKDKELSIFESRTGLIQTVLEGRGQFSIDFEGTFIQKYSLYLTLISYLILVFYIIKLPKEES